MTMSIFFLWCWD